MILGKHTTLWIKAIRTHPSQNGSKTERIGHPLPTPNRIWDVRLDAYRFSYKRKWDWVSQYNG